MQAGNREIIVEDLSPALPQARLRAKTAEKLGCLPDDFLVYREFDRMDDPLCRVIVAIFPDGRKFKFDADSLIR
jgi:hypothetical protein